METKRKYQKHKKSVKVTVKHQLNTSAGGNFDDILMEDVYPIYVTVSVNRQFTRFRSRLRGEAGPSEFEKKLSLPIVHEFAENERIIIEETLRKFNPESKNEFKLTNWSKYYESGLIDIPKWVEEAIMFDIDNTLKFVYIWSLERYMALPDDIKSRLSVLSLLGLKEADEILNKYGLLLDLRLYESALRIKYKHSHEYCLWDYKSGYYQQQLELLLGDEANSVISQLKNFESYRADYEKLFNETYVI